MGAALLPTHPFIPSPWGPKPRRLLQPSASRARGGREFCLQGGLVTHRPVSLLRNLPTHAHTLASGENKADSLGPRGGGEGAQGIQRSGRPTNQPYRVSEGGEGWQVIWKPLGTGLQAPPSPPAQDI